MKVQKLQMEIQMKKLQTLYETKQIKLQKQKISTFSIVLSLFHLDETIETTDEAVDETVFMMRAKPMRAMGTTQPTNGG